MNGRVLIVNKNIGMMRGGGETRALTFADGLEARGLEVELLHAQPLRGPLRHPLPSRLRTRTVRSPYLRGFSYRLPKGRGLTVRLDQALFTPRALRAIETMTPPDLVLTFGLFPLAHGVKRTLGLPVIVATSGGVPLGDVRAAVHAVDAVLVDGHDARLFPERFGIEPVEIRKGVDTRRFHPRDGNGPGMRAPLRLLYTGRLVPAKNVDRLLTITHAVRQGGRDVHLTLAGEGELRGRLERRARALGLADAVSFPGHIAPDALGGLYRGHDVFVIASAFDNYPNAVLEAMASGLPVVAFEDSGGIPEQVLAERTGLLAPQGDLDAFAAAVERLHDDVALRARLGRAGRERTLAEFDWSRSLDRLAALVTDVIDRHHAGERKLAS